MDTEVEINDETPAEDDSQPALRDALNAAISEHETDDSYIEGEPPEKSAQDETDAKKETEGTPDAAAEKAPEEETPNLDTEGQETQKKISKSKPYKAPVGWKKEAKEAWDTVPDAAKQAIAERERDIAIKLQETTDARRVAEQFSQVMGHYRAPLQGLGFKDPFEAINTVMATVSAMRTGNARERAQAAAQVLSTFGIDYNLLDEVVAEGKVKMPQPGNSDIEAMLDQRLKPMNDFMSQIETAQYQNQQRQAQANQASVQEFINTHEHAETVRADMADLLDMAAKRGVQMTMDEAYEKACMMHPDISRQLIEQKHNERVEQTRAEYQKKKKAASSIHGRPAGNQKPASGGSITDALNEAWDMHTGT